jgi:hypothetical protein
MPTTEERAVIRPLQTAPHRRVTLVGSVLVEASGILLVLLTADERVAWALAPGRFASIHRLRTGRVYGQMLQLLPGSPRVAVFRLLVEPCGVDRVDPRHIVQEPLPVVAGLHAEGRTLAMPAHMIDVGAHGAGLLAPRPLPAGASVVLRIGDAGKSARGLLAARVVWSAEAHNLARLGLVFTAEPGSQLNFLLPSLLRLDASLLRLLSSDEPL